MPTKDSVLELLEKNRGAYISGAAAADALGITRTAVWKAVKVLQDEGYEITAATNKGYMLAEDSDVLSPSLIKQLLDGAIPPERIEVSRCVSSTLDVAKKLAEQGAPEGTVIIAQEQTAGRGRRGRKFFSPRDTGVYISILLRPALPAERAVLITTATAVAACDAIESVTGVSAGIKWVNDIFVSGKKVSGILTEASYSMESGCLDYAALGIGLNVYPPKGGFPEEIAGTAGSILRSRQPDARSRLAAAFVRRFMEIYADLDSAGFVDEYRRRSVVIGK
ncbi:MAG: biotin--[acetyl-CoA-carboxylase] ligase, partial [Oscillospiraceae bacterium]|nr:biotin--[acetyl-CoA-carboxylase] ligase [Oscillospiraceae bacterium]